MWHVTCDKGQVTCDTWHVTRGGRWTCRYTPLMWQRWHLFNLSNLYEKYNLEEKDMSWYMRYMRFWRLFLVCQVFFFAKSSTSSRMKSLIAGNNMNTNYFWLFILIQVLTPPLCTVVGSPRQNPNPNKKKSPLRHTMPFFSIHCGILYCLRKKVHSSKSQII